MSHDSPTRRELEARLREVVPVFDPLQHVNEGPASLASAGGGGLLTGYLWGRLRGRRLAKRRRQR